jgi:hypothetical protein
MCLMLAGYNSYNMPAEVPLEFMTLNTAEDAHPLVRSCVNPVLKRAVMAMCNQLFGGARRYVRKQLGLPALAPPVLRNEKDGTSSGVLSSAVGQLAVQASVPKAVYMCAVTWETVSHMPGPGVLSSSEYQCTISAVVPHQWLEGRPTYTAAEQRPASTGGSIPVADVAGITNDTDCCDA